MRSLVAFLVGAATVVYLAGAAGASGPIGSGCIGHHPAYIEDVFEVSYDAGCSGHDEPELDPISSLPGSAQNLTWRFVLPKDGTSLVSDVGPTFWFGGAVTDPNPKDAFGEGFLEVQFYPDGILRNCTPNGGFVLDFRPNAYTVCTPVWSIHATGQKPVYHEPAEFNAMLTTGAKHAPLVLYAGDTIRLHFHLGAPGEGWHVDVLDETTNASGTVVLQSQYGPILPVFTTQALGNSLNWGGVWDTPNAFVWEIGHTSPYTSPASAFCVPGQTNCDSYNEASWAGFSPLRILGVTFGDANAPPDGWAVVSDYGGNAEVEQYCGFVGGPYCIYPWFTLGKDGTLRYGVDYNDTNLDFGKGAQFATTTDCDSATFGPDTLYCAKPILP
jgi:hypothetical protein